MIEEHARIMEIVLVFDKGNCGIEDLHFHCVYEPPAQVLCLLFVPFASEVDL